jgi:hypothetical protein
VLIFFGGQNFSKKQQPFFKRKYFVTNFFWLKTIRQKKINQKLNLKKSIPQ